MGAAAVSFEDDVGAFEKFSTLFVQQFVASLCLYALVRVGQLFATVICLDPLRLTGPGNNKV